jgi:peptide/nickel transport system substrate-binding protein
MTQKRSISRREFLHLSTMVSMGVIVSACTSAAPATVENNAAQSTDAQQAAPDTAASVPEPAAEGAYKEAPMLADMVAAGNLSPVDERLPSNPRVIPVVEEIGEYGGTWFRAAVGPGDAGIINSRLS